MFYTFYRQRGNNIQLRYKNKGETVTKTIDFYQPSLYIYTDEETEYRNLYDQPVKKITFDNIKSAKTFADSHKETDAIGLCGNKDFANQFIIELLEGQVPDYDTNQINIGRFDIETDSEKMPNPYEPSDPVNAITIHNSLENKFYSFFLLYEGAEWDISKSEKEVKDLKVEVKFFDNEEDLLSAFLDHCLEKQYDILSGWNSDGFDVPYTLERSYQFFGKKYVAKKLSPFGEITERDGVDNFYNDIKIYNIVGVSLLDYLDVYKGMVPNNQESYKLGHIAHVELGEDKISFEESKSLYKLYREDFQKFCDYNIQDVNLLVRLDQKLGLFDLIFAISYYCLSNFKDAMGKVKIWENLIAKVLFSKKVAPLYKNVGKKKDGQFAGAFVKEPVPGYYKWVVSYDLNALYPHAIMQWNIGPETIIPYDQLHEDLKKIADSNLSQKDILDGKVDTKVLQKHNVVMAANSQFYRLDKKSILAEINEELYTERKSFKKKMLKAEQDQQESGLNEEQKLVLKYFETKMNKMQNGLKLLGNGGYGSVGNENFLYYMIENAEAITLSSQVVNKWTAFELEKYLKEVLFQSDEHVYIAGDTDSMYISIDQFVRTLKTDDENEIVDLCDRFCKEVLNPFIDERGELLKNYLNCSENKMVWEREVIARSAVWRAKKNYIMQVWDSEGVRYTKPKLKIKGLEAIKMIVPEWSRKYLKECYELILNNDEKSTQSKIEEIKEIFDSFTINDIAIPSGINGIRDYHDEKNFCKKGAQVHVRGALNHNKMVREMNLMTTPELKDGTKIRFVHLKMPNPSGHDVVAFDTYLPEEFGLEKYVNRDEIFEKSFMSPLRSLLKIMNWNEEEINTLF